MNFRTDGILVVILFVCLSACSGSSEELIQTSIAETKIVDQFKADMQTATEKASGTETPSPSPPPTRAVETVTPAPTIPSYCSVEPNDYLDEIDRIYEEIIDTIDYWNGSAKGDDELLQVELRIRNLLAQTEELVPPADYQKVQEHFLAGVQGNLNAIFGITDQSDTNREGSNRSFQEEFDLAFETWEDANRNRDRVCVNR